MAETRIDIFAGLRQTKAGFLRGTEVARDKTSIEFTVPDISFSIDEDAIVARIADACAEAMRSNMLAGLTPSGTLLPGVKASTIRRRAFREKQAARDGQVAPRLQNKRGKAPRSKFYRSAQRRFFTRFKFKGRTVKSKDLFGNTRKRTVGSSGTFKPNDPSLPRNKRGVESGLMAASFAGAPAGKGKYRIYVANNRSLADRNGESAMSRVFGPGGISVWSKHAMQNPIVQDALRGALQSVSTSSKRKFMRALQQTAQSSASLVNTAATELSDE